MERRKCWMAAGMVAALGLSGCKDEKPKVYSAPPDPPLGLDSKSGGAGQTAPAEAAALRSAAQPGRPPWTVPPGWVAVADPSGVRQAGYAVTREGRTLDIAVTAFPESNGSELDNVNRWRRELTLPEVAADAIAGLAKPVKIGGETGRLYEFVNTSPRADGKPAEQTLVAQLAAGRMVVYFKLRGEATLAAQERANYLAWLASVQTGPGPSEEASDTARRPAPPLAGAGPDMRGPVATPPRTDLPQWTPPAHWRPAGEKPMRLASFEVPGEGGAKGDLSISALGGGAGGLLANVNRWRGQVGLGEWDGSALAAESEKLSLGGETATLVDLKGPEKRILAVIVPRGERTWFYKLTAPDGLVAKERENFVNFVKTVRY